MVVKTRGAAVKTDDIAATKKEAVGQALRSAVEGALEEILAAEGLSVDPAQLETRIYSNPNRFIVNYKVLFEGWVKPGSPTELRPLSGYDVVPEAPPADEADSGWAGAPEASEEDLQGGWLAPGEGSSAEAEMYHIRVEASVDTRLLRNALTGIISAGAGAEAESVVTIVILDTSDYNTFSALKALIIGTTMVKELTYNAFQRGRIVLKARTVGSASLLKQKLEAQSGGRYVVLFGGSETLNIKAAN